jgi:hypothetical protein
MQQKSNAKQKENIRAQEKSMSDMADKAMKNYESTLKTGLKLQEETVKAWSNLYNQSTAAQDYQKTFANYNKLANGVFPIAQRRLEEVIALVEKNTRTGTELVRKSVEAAQSPISGNGQNKWTELWTASMAAFRANAEAVAEINAKAIDSWIDLVKKSAEAAETRATKAA